MPLPKRSEWCFAEIRKADAARAAYLEDAPHFEEILSSIATELARSLARGQFFFGIDHSEDEENQRVTLQFHVTPQLYDMFFNARTGYRAHYWVSTDYGQDANARVLTTLWTAIAPNLPDTVEARSIVVEHNPSRTDIDKGHVSVPRSLLQASLTHLAGKIWICERLMQGVEGPSKDIREVHEGLPLSVVRWQTRAPRPNSRSTWLDLKGGYVGGEQSKDLWVRADDIHLTGWS